MNTPRKLYSLGTSPGNLLGILLGILITLLLAGCQAATPQASPQTVELKPGEETVYQDLTVRFNTVINDSRCPADAICIQAGEALISLNVSANGQAETIEMTTPEGQASQASFAGYSIELHDLQPYPLASQPTSPENYTALLVLSVEG